MEVIECVWPSVRMRMVETRGATQTNEKRMTDDGKEPAKKN